MGMYTQYSFTIPLKEMPKDLEDEIIEDIETFNTCSFYFTGTSNSVLKLENDNGIISRTVYINCDISFNSDERIENFINKIKAYIKHNGDLFLGYSRYEECNNPKLWFINSDNEINTYFNLNVKE